MLELLRVILDPDFVAVRDLPSTNPTAPGAGTSIRTVSACDLTVLEGTQPSVTATFRVAAVLTDPGDILVRTLSPSGTLTSYTTPDATITNGSIGVWTFTFPAALTEVGTWKVYIAGTDIVLVAAETSLAVKATTVV